MSLVKIFFVRFLSFKRQLSLKSALGHLEHLIDFEDPIISCNELFSVTRVHPLFVDRYVKILNRSIAGQLFHNIKGLVYLFLSIMQAFLSLRFFICNPHDFSTQPNPKIIIFSHILNNKNSMPNEDQYFGFLINLLEKKGCNFLVFYIDHTRSNKFLRKLNKNCYVIGKNLGFFYESEILKKLILFFWTRKNTGGKSLEQQPNKRLSQIMWSNILTSSTVNNLRFLFLGKFLFARFRPSYVLTTNEGHAWEQMIRFAAKTADRNVKCVGYIHSFPFSDRIDVFESSLNQYRNDAIGFTGRSAIDTYRSNQSTTDSSLLNRFFILGAGPFEPVIAGPHDQILCIPEGLGGEVEVMFEFILRCSALWPQFGFTFRVHPIISYRDRLEKRINSLAIKNLKISNASFKEDLSASGVVLYRGSTAVFQAISSGLFPVYVNLDEAVGIDVLKGLSFGHSSVGYPSDLEASVCEARRNFDFNIARGFVDNLWCESNVGWFKDL